MENTFAIWIFLELPKSIWPLWTIYQFLHGTIQQTKHTETFKSDLWVKSNKAIIHCQEICLFRLSDHNIICFQQTQISIFKQYIILKYLWLNKLDDWFIFENLGKYTSEILLNQDFLCQVSTERDFFMIKYEFLENMVYHRKTGKTSTVFALTGATVMGCRSMNRPRTEA